MIRRTFLLGMVFVLPSYSMNVSSLLPDEQNTVSVFQQASPKVVYVHRLATVTNKISFKKCRFQMELVQELFGMIKAI